MARVYIAFFLMFMTADATVTFPDPGPVCIKGDIVFTCRVTDAASLTFNIGGVIQTLFNSDPVEFNGFTLQLIDAVANTDYNATATLSNVQLKNDSISIKCLGGSDSEEQVLTVQGPFTRSTDDMPTVNVSNDCSNIILSWTPPSSPPCNVSSYTLTFNSKQQGCTHTESTDSIPFIFTPLQDCHISQYTSITVTAVDGAGRSADIANVIDLSDFLESSCSAHLCSDNCPIKYQNGELGFKLNSVVGDDGRICARVSSCHGELRLEDGFFLNISTLGREIVVNANSFTLPQTNVTVTPPTVIVTPPAVTVTPPTVTLTLTPPAVTRTTTSKLNNDTYTGFIIGLIILAVLCAVLLIVIVILLIRLCMLQQKIKVIIHNHDGIELENKPKKF